jgi:hypothetical protein
VLREKRVTKARFSIDAQEWGLAWWGLAVSVQQLSYGLLRSLLVISPLTLIDSSGN